MLIDPPRHESWSPGPRHGPVRCAGPDRKPCGNGDAQHPLDIDIFSRRGKLQAGRRGSAFSLQPTHHAKGQYANSKPERPTMRRQGGCGSQSPPRHKITCLHATNLRCTFLARSERASATGNTLYTSRKHARRAARRAAKARATPPWSPSLERLQLQPRRWARPVQRRICVGRVAMSGTARRGAVRQPGPRRRAINGKRRSERRSA